MVKVFIFFGFDKFPEVITRPHPYVDAGGVHMLGDLVKCRTVSLADALYKLQHRGYSLQLDGMRAVIAAHSERESVDEVDTDLKEAGINRADCSIIWK